MAVSLRASIDRVSNPQNLDESVDEVFRLMLGCTANVTTNQPMENLSG
jgi:hypothetical protein